MSGSGRCGWSAIPAACRLPLPRSWLHAQSVEPDVEVRSQLACSAKRLPGHDALPLVFALISHDEDADDIHIPLLLWWAIEAKVAQTLTRSWTCSRMSSWDRSIAVNTIEERLMRRLAAAGTRKDLDR